MIIYVKTLTGKTITIETESGDTIRSVKEKILAEEKIEVSQQRLLFKNTEMEDTEILNHYGLYEEATVYLVVRMNQSIVNESVKVSQRSSDQSVMVPGHIAVIIQTNGEKDSELVLNIPESFKISQVKEEIKNNRKLGGDIILTHDGKTLADGKSLKELGIESNAVINLTVRLTGGNK